MTKIRSIGRRALMVACMAGGLAAGLFGAAGDARAQSTFIVVSSTTSTEQSGLFKHLLPVFTKQTGIEVRVVALGTGQALDAARRGDADVLPPTQLLGDGAVIADGASHIEVRYFGPNHSDSNLLFLLPTDRGRMLVWVDGIEPGIAPYRNLPDTDFAGYLHTLEQVERLDFDCVVGGHTGPGERHWVADYREYVLRLLDATHLEYRAAGGQVPLPGEDGVAMTERVRGEVTRAAATHLEGRFGHWSGFTQWAPQTADRILSYLITGN